VIDTQARSLVKTFKVGAGRVMWCSWPDMQHAYVNAENDGNIGIIDLTKERTGRGRSNLALPAR